MLNVLNVEDDDEGYDGDGGGPEAEVPDPDACEVLDLEGGLDGSRGDESCENSLVSASGQSRFEILRFEVVRTNLA